MHVITRRRLKEFWRTHPDAESSLVYWYTITKHAEWNHFADLRRSFPSADQVGRLTVFNIAGNKYRLVARIDYRFKKVYVRGIFTHAEYDKEGWKDDPWF